VLSEIRTLGDEANQYISYVQLPWLKFDFDQPLQVNLDGEPIRSKVFEFRVLPQAINFILPAEAPLVDEPATG
jgi:diacylglycerol kinase family enzyme